MQEQRPRIGIVPNVDLVPNRGIDYRRYVVYAEIADRLYRAGAQPLIVPFPPDDEGVRSVAASVDAIVLSGGAFDVDPRHYGERPHARLGTLKPDRTDLDFKLTRLALGSGLPLLGLCGGMQSMNVALGGSLFQDLLSQRPTAIEHVQQHNRRFPSHEVEVAAGTRLAGICGAGRLEVNSTHHQGIKELGRDLVASATAGDGLIEAFELLGHPFFVAVQWHPEALDEAPGAHRQVALFTALTAAARERARAD
ncbi:MAG: gamma-glutamyl-gamma-aminobutyrate hydrolase family protein [Deltaproteobacteria bacterium]|nr:gamma-glutamyl-gamma-aminobutyrate hydrolase family protein [Deltaproteobacteria bacterium]